MISAKNFKFQNILKIFFIIKVLSIPIFSSNKRSLLYTKFLQKKRLDKYI